MPYQVFYVESPLGTAPEGNIEDVPKKEHYKTKEQALGRVRNLCKTTRHHSILLAYRSDYVLSGFSLQFELEAGMGSE